MLNNRFDFITDWTVASVQFFYKILVQNTFFILSNSVFLIFLLFLKLTINNFLIFSLPIYLLLVSISAQLSLNSRTQENVSIRYYFKLYKEIFKNVRWICLLYTFLIVFIVFEVQILLIVSNNIVLYPFIITSFFLISSMLYILLISSDTRSKHITFKQKLVWSMLISYRLPLVTVVNIIYILLTLFCLQNFSLAYLCFIGGAINYFIFLNLTRRFSVELYFSQIEKSKIYEN